MNTSLLNRIEMFLSINLKGAYQSSSKSTFQSQKCVSVSRYYRWGTLLFSVETPHNCLLFTGPAQNHLPGACGPVWNWSLLWNWCVLSVKKIWLRQCMCGHCCITCLPVRVISNKIISSLSLCQNGH